MAFGRAILKLQSEKQISVYYSPIPKQMIQVGSFYTNTQPGFGESNLKAYLSYQCSRIPK